MNKLQSWPSIIFLFSSPLPRLPTPRLLSLGPQMSSIQWCWFNKCLRNQFSVCASCCCLRLGSTQTTSRENFIRKAQDNLPCVTGPLCRESRQIIGRGDFIRKPRSAGMYHWPFVQGIHSDPLQRRLHKESPGHPDMHH